MTSIRSLLVALAIPAVFAIGCTQPVGTSDTDQSAEALKTESNAKTFEKISLDAKIARILPTPDGKIGGLLLDNGQIVRAHADTTELAVGDTVHIDAIKPPADAPANVLHGATVTKDGKVAIEAKQFDFGGMHKGKHAMNGKPQVGNAFEKPDWKNMSEADKVAKKAEWKAKKAEWEAKNPGKLHDGNGKHHGPHFDMSSLTDVTTTSTVEALLPGHHGKTHALLLADGTVAYLPPHGDDLGLTKGASVTVKGKGGDYKIGKAMVVQSIKLPSGEEKQI
jgi:hypothetical protein